MAATPSNCNRTPTRINLDVPLTLRGTLSAHIGAGGDVKFSKSATEAGGPRGITKTGPGTLRFLASNSFAGEMAVHEGSLSLESATVPSVSGNLSIGDGNGAALSARVILSVSDQIADPARVTVNADGLFQLAQASDIVAELIVSDGVVTLELPSLTMGRLSMTGGTLEIPTGGTFRLAGPVIATSSERGPARIRWDGAVGSLNLIGETRTFTVADGPAPIDLEIALPIASAGTTAGVIKDGPGTLTFSGATTNTYPGETLVRRGRLELDRVNALAVPRDLVVGTGAGLAVAAFLRP